ncbi:hypothetical protein B0T25DRAFT_458513 [Lasiosphaeria hispida]|uniref:Uncharacterized protein n=1 Tax=Lasiosphaeria hispida TaxID=260671 RepID=A0AAJ0HDK5_9PEZI|nr:hypothetical protein B0T25DRAFT_458513 [Lasiosphaeria hispida]
MSNPVPVTPDRKATAELLLISPPAPPSASSSRKRRITPAAEAASPKRIAIVTGVGAVSPLVGDVRPAPLLRPFSWFRTTELAHIDHRLPLHPITPSPDSSFDDTAAPDSYMIDPSNQGTVTGGLQVLRTARHIILPFDLRDKPGDVLDPGKRELVKSIFPETTGLACDGFFITLQLRTLPPKPWPLTIGGVPLYLTLAIGSDDPFPQGTPVGRRNGAIAADRHGRDVEDWEPLFHIIKTHFEQLKVPITEVIFWGSHFTIVLKHRDVDMAKVPCQAANLRCVYVFDDEMGRPSAPQARRLSDPTMGNPDTSEYETPQPGLRVSSSHPPSNPDSFFSTTSGVLLEDSVGNKYMTVASHGFPAECGTDFFHALPGNGRKIGELVMEVSHTDVALVKLRDTETFSNTTFENGENTQPIQLNRLGSVKGRQRFELVCLDSPDTGLLDGSFMATSYQAIPSDGNGPSQQWVLTSWIYRGQGSGQDLPDGICGSSIWNEEGEVLGFFRYAPKDGVMQNWCAGIAADELIDRGFTLVPTSEGAQR